MCMGVLKNCRELSQLVGSCGIQSRVVVTGSCAIDVISRGIDAKYEILLSVNVKVHGRREGVKVRAGE